MLKQFAFGILLPEMLTPYQASGIKPPRKGSEIWGVDDCPMPFHGDFKMIPVGQQTLLFWGSYGVHMGFYRTFPNIPKRMQACDVHRSACLSAFEILTPRYLNADEQGDAPFRLLVAWCCPKETNHDLEPQIQMP